MLACQAIKYPMPDAESNFPRRKKGGASFASTSYDFEDEENTKRFSLSLSFSTICEGNWEGRNEKFPAEWNLLLLLFINYIITL